MALKTVFEEAVGKAKVRILTDGASLRGFVIRDGKQSAILEDSELDRLKLRLRKEVLKSDPSYFGFDGAMARFRSFNPLGFRDPNYVTNERAYKVSASELLRETLPLELALEASPEQAISIAKVVGKTNLLAHQHEQQQMRSLLTGNHGNRFVRAAATIALGEIETGLKSMVAISRKEGRISWPMATYLPFLWEPNSNMFLKPEVTQDFARRVGHEFATCYEPDLDAATYGSLLDLARSTQKQIASLDPQDWIDVQGFIWVVGKYQDGDPC